MKTSEQHTMPEDIMLTKRQVQILQYIQRTVEDRGYPPTVREIGLAVGLNSTSSVHSQLNKLEKKGVITKCKSSPRTIEVLSQKCSIESSLNYLMVPVIGEVAEGASVLTTDDEGRVQPLSAKTLESREYFALKSTSESMVNEGIHIKDILVVLKQSSAANGDLVVALVGENVTIQRVLKEDTNMMILGKVIALQRIF